MTPPTIRAPRSTTLSCKSWQQAALRMLMNDPEVAEHPQDTDPGTGGTRHVDAGCERAIEGARERGVHIPILEG